MSAYIPSIRSHCTQLYGCLPILVFAVTLPNERLRLSSQVYKSTVNCASLSLEEQSSSICILLKLLFFFCLSAFCTPHWQMLIALWCHLKSWSFADTVLHLWRSDASWLWCVPQCAGMKASISYYSWELEIAGWPSANPGSQLQLGQGMPQSHYFYPTNTPHSGVLRKQL